MICLGKVFCFLSSQLLKNKNTIARILDTMIGALLTVKCQLHIIYFPSPWAIPNPTYIDNYSSFTLSSNNQTNARIQGPLAVVSVQCHSILSILLGRDISNPTDIDNYSPFTLNCNDQANIRL